MDNKFVHWIMRVIYIILIVAILALFSYQWVLRSIHGILEDGGQIWDFTIFYTAGQIWNEGDLPYGSGGLSDRIAENEELFGYNGTNATVAYYPPQALFLFSLMAKNPIQTAYWILFILNIIILLISLCLLGWILSRYISIGLPEILLLSSFMITGMRTNIRFNQVSLIVLLPMLTMFILAGRNKKVSAGIALGLTSLKPTFFPLFWVYYLFKRQYRIAVVSLITAGLATIGPLILTKRPLLGSLLAFLDTQKYHGQSDIDSPSPFYPRSATLHNLEALVYRIFNVESTLTLLLSWAIIGVIILFTFYLISKNNSSSVVSLLDFSLISMLSLLMIYHRAYDSFLIFPAILSIYIYIQSIQKKTIKWLWIAGLVGIITVHVVPGDISMRFAERYPVLLESYVFRVLAPIHIWVNLVVLVTLLWMKMQQLREGKMTDL